MGYTIAVAGKGGVGKTTFCGLLIDWLKKTKKGSILAVDADPNANLGNALGLAPQENIGQMIDSIAKNPSLVPVGMSKDEYINYRIQTSMSETNGFDLLVMGRPEGPGCYCYANNLLRHNVGKLIEDYDYVVIDNEAGMEHFSRRTTRAADCLALVSEYSVPAVRTAVNINVLIKELDIKIKKTFLVVNRFTPLDSNHLTGFTKKDDTVESLIRDSKIECAGSIPFDDDLLELNVKGLPVGTLNEASAIRENIKKIGEKICP